MKKHILIEPVWQTIWQWPAVVNLICGGTASGYYILSLFAHGSAGSRAGLESLVAPLLVLIGFGAVAVEAGRPSAARYLLHHLSTSWMSREVLTGSIFILVSTLDAIFSQPALKWLAAPASGGLLLSQAMMVYKCRAVTVWNDRLSLYHFLASGIYLGFGLLLLIYGLGYHIPKPSILGIGLLSSGVCWAVWHRMVHAASEEGSMRQALVPLKDSKVLTFSMGMVHFVSMVILLVLLLAAAYGIDLRLLRGGCVVAGMVILIGGSAQKRDIILKANILRELGAEHCTKRLMP